MAKYQTPNAVCDWLTAHDIDPHHVPIDGVLTIENTPDGRVIRCERSVPGEHGQLQIDERGNLLTEIITVPLVSEPPPLWKPYERPTREQLLKVVETVRALHQPQPDGTGFPDSQQCRTCSQDGGDGYQYLVRYPCPTTRALDGEQPDA